MFLKTKLCLTILALYEIAAVVLLHIPRTCDAIFCTSLCDDHIFKYFVVCIALPLVILMILMWIRELVHAVRRRRSLAYRAKAAVSDMVSDISHRIKRTISSADMERYLTAALIVGLKKYSARHPGAQDAFGRVFGDMGYDVDDAEPVASSAPATRRAPRSGTARKKR